MVIVVECKDFFNNQMMMSNNLEIVLNKEDNPNFTLVDFVGDMDSFNIKDKRKILEKLVDSEEKKYLVFSFLNLNYINSESIGLLFHSNELLQATGKRLVIVAAKKNVVDVLTEIGLFDQVLHFSTMPDFLKSIENA